VIRFRLGPEPVGETAQLGQVFGIADAARFARLDGEFDLIDAGQVLLSEIGVGPEIDVRREILDEPVVLYDPRDHGTEQDDGTSGSDQQHVPFLDNEVGPAFHH